MSDNFPLKFGAIYLNNSLGKTHEDVVYVLVAFA